MHMVFTTERFFEVALESSPELDLNTRLQNSVQSSQSTLTETQLCIST